MSHILPPEALDYIIDFLHNDQKSLSACSLASSTLMPAARHHSFSDLRLAPAEINSFLSLLDTPWNTVPAALQSIAIESREYKEKEEDELRFYFPDDLSRTVQRIGGVRFLRFEGINLSDISPPFMHSIYQANKLEAVTLCNTTVHDMEPLLRYLASLPSLRALSISRLQAENCDDGDLPRAMTKFRMPFLDGGSSSSEILSWLQAQTFVPAVEVFVIDLNASPSACALVTEYANHMGDFVDEILLKWPTDQSEPAYMDYSLFPNLKAVRLQVGLRLGYGLDLLRAGSTIRTVAEEIDFTKLTLEIMLLPIDFVRTSIKILEHPAFLAPRWQGILDALGDCKINDFTLIILGLPKCQRAPVKSFLQFGPFRSLYKAGHMRILCN